MDLEEEINREKQMLLEEFERRKKVGTLFSCKEIFFFLNIIFVWIFFLLLLFVLTLNLSYRHVKSMSPLMIQK